MTDLHHRHGTNELACYGWAYDAAGRLIRETAADGTVSYQYDADGQLTNVAYADPTRGDETYNYDATGNRTGGSYQTGTGNRLLEDADYTYQYDAEGNRTRRTAKSDGSYEAYVWDHRNRLVSVEFRTQAGVLTQQGRYDYDAFDNLIRRRVDTTGDGTFDEEQSFVHDLGGKGGLDDVVLAFDETGNVSHRYLHGSAVDELFADESAVDGILWALSDRQGTVKDWVEYDSGTETTSVFNHVEYDAYGKITSQSNANHTITAGGYTGRYHDPLTSLRYHRARWTDPNTGWLSEDPIGFGGGDVNLYRYVGNGPGNFVDPAGLAADVVILIDPGTEGVPSRLNAEKVEDLIEQSLANAGLNVPVTIRPLNEKPIPGTMDEDEQLGFCYDRQPISPLDAPGWAWANPYWYTAGVGPMTGHRLLYYYPTRNKVSYTHRLHFRPMGPPPGAAMTTQLPYAYTKRGGTTTDVCETNMIDHMDAKKSQYGGGNFDILYANLILHEVFYLGLTSNSDRGTSGVTSNQGDTNQMVTIPPDLAADIRNELEL